MTKPQMIRADTIDLQDQTSPSAKDHTRQPTSPGAIGEGPPAPHQAAQLKRASLDGHELSSRSPRASQDLSNKELQLLHDIHSDIDESDANEIEQSLVAQRNGEQSGHDGDVDGEDDESLDDDMMDKISSSPSIDDGGYPRRTVNPWPWPNRSASLFANLPSAAFDTPSVVEEVPKPKEYADGLSELARIEEPCKMNPPTTVAQEEENHQRVTQGQERAAPCEYPSTSWRIPLPPIPVEPGPPGPPGSCLGGLIREDSIESRDKLMSMVSEMSKKHEESSEEDYDNDSFEGDFTGLKGFLIPLHDPFLDHNFDLPEPDGICGEVRGFAKDEFSSDSSDLGSHVDERQATGGDEWHEAYDKESRFTDSGWGGECLQETEDIDFEFVYALHTFVATVEGQANATKGDTMVLLDDSNSYWWLVRVVKDSSIGYLPAEHIETPTERLARLNKHRNIDLSQTMLGDNPEKSRNPLKKAMRRRNAKTVSFAEPTYFEASEVEYSSEEDNDSEMDYAGNEAVQDTQAQQQQQSQQTQQSQQGLQQQQTQVEAARVEPLHITRKSDNTDENVSDGTVQNGDDADKDKPRTSTEMLEAQHEEANKNPRRMRNTDSFYKDESIETKKITLTPNLLREEKGGQVSAPVSPAATAPQDVKARASLEGSEKPASIEKVKEEKKKEKKQSKLGRLFGRKKDKKEVDDDEEWIEKARTGTLSPSQRISSDNVSMESREQASPQKSQPTRQSSKLQKQPPSKSNSLKKTATKEEEPQQPRTEISARAPRVESTLIPDGALANPFEDPAGSEPKSPIKSKQEIQVQPQKALDTRTKPNDIVVPEFSSPQSESSLRNVFSPIREALRPNGTIEEEPKAEKVKKAKSRMALDDSDSSAEDEQTSMAAFPTAPLRSPPEPIQQKPPSPSKDRLSESPVQVSPVIAPTRLPPLVGDSSSHSDGAVSPVSPSSTPELIERPAESTTTSRSFASTLPSAPTPRPPGAFSPAPDPMERTPPLQQGQNEPGSPSTNPGSSRTQSEWSDRNLRQYLETATDEIRDLMMVVSDTRDVVVTKDNAVVRSFDPEMERFKEMERKLDRMMVDLCARNGV